MEYEIDGHHSTVEDLFRKNYKILRAYAYRLLNDKGMAEDVVQDVFCELWKRRNDLIMEENLKSYLFRSTYTKSINCLNRKGYMDHDFFGGSVDSCIQELYLQTQPPDQESDLIYNELQKKITEIIESLPEQCRKIFILSRQYGLKNKEIAVQLKISVKAVEKQISKALVVFRSNLKMCILFMLFFLFV